MLTLLSLIFFLFTEHAMKVKAEIKKVVIDLTEKMIEQDEQSRKVQYPGEGGQSSQQPTLGVGMSRGVTSKGNRYARQGSTALTSGGRNGLTYRMMAEQLLGEYITRSEGPGKTSAVEVNGESLRWHGLLNWWKRTGMTMNGGKFACLGRALKVLLTVLGAAAGLEGF